MHLSNKESFDDGALIRAKSVICLWKTYSPQSPFRTIVSEITIEQDCICILKDFAVICGTKEGIIQLWDIRESLCSSLLSQFMKVPKEYYLEGDTMNEEQSTLVSLVRASDIVVASLDSRGKVELW